MASSAAGGLANSAAAGREEEAILKAKQRLASTLAIKEACSNGSRLSQMLLLLRDLVDGLILDVAIEAHREAAMGTHRSCPMGGAGASLEPPAPEDDAWEAAYIPRGSSKANGAGGTRGDKDNNHSNGNGGSELGSGGDGDGCHDSDEEESPKGKHGLDLFGQRHPPVPTDMVTCLHCSRKVMSGRFAPHLEKCMGKGRNSRAASRMISASSPDNSGPHRGANSAPASASNSKRQPPQHGKGAAVSSARSARTGMSAGWAQAHRLSLLDPMGDDTASNGAGMPPAGTDGIRHHVKKPKHEGGGHALMSAAISGEPTVKHGDVSTADDGSSLPLSPFDVIAGSSDEEPVGKRLVSGAKVNKPPAKKPPAGKPTPGSSKPPPVSSSSNAKKKKTKIKTMLGSGADGAHGVGDKRGGADPLAADGADPLLFDAAGAGAILWDDAFPGMDAELGEMPGLDDPLAGLSLPGLDALAGISTEDLPPGLAMAFSSNPGGGGGGAGHKGGKGSGKGGSAYLANLTCCFDNTLIAIVVCFCLRNVNASTEPRACSGAVITRYARKCLTMQVNEGEFDAAPLPTSLQLTPQTVQPGLKLCSGRSMHEGGVVRINQVGQARYPDSSTGAADHCCNDAMSKKSLLETYCWILLN
eukprot:jgi/Mesvir1/17284/Mv07689-RA.1